MLFLITICLDNNKSQPSQRRDDFMLKFVKNLLQIYCSLLINYVFLHYFIKINISIS